MYYRTKYVKITTMIKIIALDIDGTLLNDRKEILEETKQYLTGAMKAGIKVVIASGRPVEGIVRFADELGMKEYDSYIISFNGGKIVNYRTGEVICNRTLDREMTEKIYHLSKNYAVTLMTYKDRDLITENGNDEYARSGAKINMLRLHVVENLLEYIDYPVNKFLMVADGDYLGSIEPEVKEKLGGRTSVYRSEPYYLEIMPQGTDKGTALEYLVGYLGYERENLMAFGDGYNDSTMIEYAGLGIAMGNACDEVKEAADYITLSNNEGGIVYALKQFQVV